jgi:diguanylate cyclase (GGDEF)-like protein
VDASLIPEVLVLAVSIILFQPIIARAGRHATTWLCAWIFLLLHYTLHVVTTLPGTVGLGFGIASLWCLHLAALWFLRASGNVNKTRIHWVFTLELAVPLLLQAVLTVLHPQDPPLQRVAGALLMVPAAHMLVVRSRYRALIGLASAFALSGLIVMLLPQIPPALINGSLLAILFLSTAWVFVEFVPRVTPAVIVAVAGLVCWGIVIPALMLLEQFYPALESDHHVVIVAQFIFVVGIVFSFIEQVLERAEHLAQHDPLTGLPNARLFEQRASVAMAESIATGAPLAFLVIDIDLFKKINDTLGHQAGDELLRALAVRLSWHIGEGDMLARTGGDEFTAILAGVADEHHLRFIARAMLSAASVPFVLDGKPIDCHISIGIAVSPRNGNNLVRLREEADQAMYEAKHRGGSLLAFAGEGRNQGMTLTQ